MVEVRLLGKAQDLQLSTRGLDLSSFVQLIEFFSFRLSRRNMSYGVVSD